MKIGWLPSIREKLIFFISCLTHGVSQAGMDAVVTLIFIYFCGTRVKPDIISFSGQISEMHERNSREDQIAFYYYVCMYGAIINTYY
jgi:hypothetical protein